MKRIGIDVGGTNTDAVLLDGERILRSIKTATTTDVTTGIRTAMSHILSGDDAGAAGDIRAIMIGTTHFTNAVIERRGLSKVAVVRIGLPSASSIVPMQAWPKDLRDRVEGPVFLIEGGHEFDGRPIVPFDRERMYEVAREIRDSGVKAAAITAVFSPVTSACEEEAASILREVAPKVSITLSCQLGRIGLIERENATILNSALHSLARETVAAFERAIAESGADAPLFLTQNDGTVMQSGHAARFPVLCFASGPTNSMRGARMLSGIDEAIVLDVGGTTTDAGFINGGFPREANSKVDIGGVSTFFRMPDVVAIALGGGTIVHDDAHRIGPESVGYRISEKARVKGGDTLTLTDVAVKLERMAFGEPSLVEDIDGELVARVDGWVHDRLADLVDRMKTSAAEVPVIAVGGGAALVPDRLPGISRVIKVKNAGVANAVGAAMAQVSGEIDQIFYDIDRETAIATARRLAESRAIEAGADPATLDLLDVEDTPLSYIPGNPLRVRVRVIGNLSI
ncbi:hydantoinase/oxoprolinase family protein [Sinorhizobium sp. BG8]|uniref:hydantoinase/oxoprolinase N-terminal domain-containing protein n=1 Tax=Sinorhizobium sp. BG8 TaxID=2613773 RepID=UPI00193DC93E|nr:hydantoinase/oxoprolinase family protein [Sinorhizobium sp. BG8]QRM57680.1 hydantoinase/oxoprolinase family protein [Sinorhizobium sp. BG8]